MDRVVLESRHKFVYYDDETIESLRKLEDNYSAKIDSEEPIVVYIKEVGLPTMDTKYVLSCDIVRMFYERYFQLLIFSEIINSISGKIDDEKLNHCLRRVFKLCSYMGKEKINDVDTLKKLLIQSREMYSESYIDYMKNGKTDVYDRVPIRFIMMDNLVMALKEAIGLKKHFCLILELGEDISLNNCMAINNYINSRCNGYLSMNVLLCGDSEWKSYYTYNGEFIQGVHDYTEKDFRKNKTRVYKK